MERARDYLDAHATEIVASSLVEVLIGLDRIVLARRFRAAFGTSPSMAGAAFACGFADQSHFTRQFRRAFGATPGRWRASSGKSGPETCVALACSACRLHA